LYATSTIYLALIKYDPKVAFSGSGKINVFPDEAMIGGYV
jgi:hypothetical protein